MSEFNPHDLARTEDFHRQLRYFNDMVLEMRSFLGLEASEVKPCQEAERELNAAIIRCQAALATLAEAEDAVAAAKDALARANKGRQDIQAEAERRIEATMRTVDTRPNVRPEYKGSLREVFDFSYRDVAAAVNNAFAAALPPPPAYGPEAGGILAPIPTAAHGYVGVPAPAHLQVYAENHAVNRLTWEYPAEAPPSLSFEVEAAVDENAGAPGLYSVPDVRQFRYIANVAGDGPGEYRHSVEDAYGSPARDGVLVRYRVRAVSGALVSEWSDIVSVPCVNRAEARGGLLDRLFAARR
jgi:hypothetical protein